MKARVPDLLPCGRQLVDLVGQVADGWDPWPAHDQACTHCRHALLLLGQLWARLDALAADDVPSPHPLETAVLRRIRLDRFVCDAVQAVNGVLSRLTPFLRYATPDVVPAGSQGQ